MQEQKPAHEPLNTAKQVHPENVGAVNRAELTPEAAASAQGHDVPGHDHRPADLTPTTETKEPSPYTVPLISFAMLVIGLVLDHAGANFFASPLRIIWYSVAYLLVGWKVIRTAVLSIPSGNVFNEFLLMSLATIGAFALGEYAEGVAVMLFYTVGELFQDAAVNRAKRNIRALLEIQATEVSVLRNGQLVTLSPQQVNIGDVIESKSGEKVALDGILQTERAAFNTAALTGESVPQTKHVGEEVLAGMITMDTLVRIQVTAAFKDTKLARILTLVQQATARKAKTQQFITRFAKVYTPIVVFLAVALTLLPFFFVEHYVFRDWLYRALVFLVISCPCALLVSIPLGYFGGIGAASRAGILFKGSNYLDLMRQLDTVVLDKTGTLTKGVFAVQDVHFVPGIQADDLLPMVAALEAKSTHPVAQAIVTYVPSPAPTNSVAEVEEIPGHGLRGQVGEHSLLVGNARLLQKFSVAFPSELEQVIGTLVLVALDNRYAGYLTVADELREDAAQAVRELRKEGIRHVVMLSGDKSSIVQRVATQVGIQEAYGDLLPEGKVEHVQRLQAAGNRLAFLGDGVNDAPVVALADVGVAIGGLGSDATIETADVVIQTDHPSKLATAVRISRATHRVVWQNIGLAFGVKLVVLALGAGGVATMWEAVFADVGVALLAILNAVRIQRMKF
ncbi:heavy metal translocating P-type ATPase [Hymenobacter coalescens]